ncbi:MAG: pentapeptide repeat-containing protein [Nodosilinea sp. WJT8-NPBG4]|nr:pentapeptide repeat-containing protein [Nodosilinea sp. WJT8-NPBG4]
MANSEHFSILKAGKTIWNQWRSGNVEIDPDLSDINLEGLNLTGRNFYCVNFSGAQLKGVVFSRLDEMNSDEFALRENEFRGTISVLKGANLSHANLKGARLAGVNLDGACLESSDLSNSVLRGAGICRSNLNNSNLLNADCTGANISGSSLTKAYLRGCLLYDATLLGTDLTGSNFVEANLSGVDLRNSTLRNVDFRQADLTEARLFNTNFVNVNLTGSCVENWQIDNTTHFESVTCDYVYLLRNHQERRPSSGTFAPGEFSKLFQEVLDTIDLIFQKGVDWKAFVQTFNDIKVEHQGADLEVLGFENKGDGVVVVKLQALPKVDKSAIHQSFMQRYKKALKNVEKLYKVQLHAKDREIEIYREKSNNFFEIAKLQAQQTFTVDVKATAESKTMQGNDYSQKISFGGDATGNVFQAGQGNTAELQQVTLPPPDRVNIQAELAALQAILESLNDPVTTGIAAKLDAEAAKPAPDKSVVATTLETGLTYARNLQGFAEAIDQLRPHVQNAAGWLGEHGTKLLPLVGLVL